MQLRVRSLCGAELLLDMPPLSVRVQVVEIKRRSLAQLWWLRDREALAEEEEEAKESEPTIQEAEVDDGVETRVDKALAASFLIFRGQLLADVDDVNLFALAPSDFFVLVEDDEDDADNGEEVQVEQQARWNTDSDEQLQRKRRKVIDTEGSIDRVDASVLSLVEMGFTLDQARDAMKLAQGEVAHAVALLMGEQVSVQTASTNRLEEFATRLIQRYPELSAIESLLRTEQFHNLKNVSKKDDLAALVMLKESFRAHTLAQMNDNPAATALFLSLPQQYESSKLRGTGTPKSNTKVKSKKPLEVDLTSDSPRQENQASSSDQGAIDRLTAMGFPSDLVVAIYESCGGNEELAVNLLLESLA